MPRLFTNAAAAMRRLWWGLRQASGDAAYENYLRRAKQDAGHSHCRDAAGNAASRRDFYLDSLRRRYSGISRCC